MKLKKYAAIALLPLMFVWGCASAERTAFVVSGTASVTVDTAMKMWADWVVFNKRAGTPVATAAEDEVRKGYARYQAESARAEKIVKGYLAAKAEAGSADGVAVRAATEAVRIAATELIHLVYRLKGDAVPASSSIQLPGFPELKGMIPAEAVL